jgi:hypothetical protein
MIVDCQSLRLYASTNNSSELKCFVFVENIIEYKQTSLSWAGTSLGYSQTIDSYSYGVVSSNFGLELFRA